MIKNKQGKDCIGSNHYVKTQIYLGLSLIWNNFIIPYHDRYRSATKVNVIVTSTGIPLSINVVKANIHDSTLTD